MCGEQRRKRFHVGSKDLDESSQTQCARLEANCIRKWKQDHVIVVCSNRV